jgi:hypothetical protein
MNSLRRIFDPLATLEVSPSQPETFGTRTKGELRMDEFLKEHWSVVSEAPLTFILFAIVIGPAVFAFSRIVLGGALDASRERLAAAKEEIARLKSHRDELVKRLGTHGEDIEEIKAALAAAPKIHVSDEPPPASGFGKDGDIWLQTSKK